MPSNYKELMIIVTTPYYSWTDIIPVDWFRMRSTYVARHGDSNQQVMYRLFNNGTVDSVFVLQNSVPSTGSMYLYYR